MIATFAGVFGNAAMMATMGGVMRVGREKFMNQDGDLTAVIGSRILVQALGLDDIDPMLDHLKQIDFAALKSFGQ